MLAGYIIHFSGGDIGTRGQGYTYTLAGNGLFLDADKDLLRVRIPLAEVMVRGLPPLEPLVELRHGKIPHHLLSLSMDMMAASPDQEMFASIVWDGEKYSIRIPKQQGGVGEVTYETVSGAVVGIHSHGRMGAFFSYADDRDDQGFLISLVLGHVDTLIPEVKARLCVYGYFALIRLSQVFDGLPPLLEDKWNTD